MSSALKQVYKFSAEGGLGIRGNYVTVPLHESPTDVGILIRLNVVVVPLTREVEGNALPGSVEFYLKDNTSLPLSSSSEILGTDAANGHLIGVNLGTTGFEWWHSEAQALLGSIDTVRSFHATGLNNGQGVFVNGLDLIVRADAATVAGAIGATTGYHSVTTEALYIKYD